MSSAGPAYAAAGSPPPSTLPRIVRSGVTPAGCCTPPGDTLKPVITSSKMSNAPASLATSRRKERNPGSGLTSPMLAGKGSQISAATGRARSAAATASRSFHGTTIVSAACAAVTPGLAGIPWVASPEPASARSPSTCPW